MAVEKLPAETKVSNIIWKHGKNKAAEWFKEDGEAVTYFGDFNTETVVLDKTTWSLVFTNLQPKYNGYYSAEVNNKDPTRNLVLSVIGE